MKTVAFYTLGCKVNQYDTEAISRLFENEGYTVVGFDEKADVYVINTCTVTGLSARKSRQVIRRVKSSNRDAVLVVTGCYAQTAHEEISSIPGVDLIIGTKERNRIIEYINRLDADKKQLNLVTDIMHDREFEDLRLDKYKGRTRAFVKIQEGCSQFCAYCIIPYARGPVRSRPPEEVLSEVEKLACGGFKEVVLTGIHIASYGRDIKNTSLPEIMKHINKVDALRRFRLGSIEPTTITDEFIGIISKLDKLCPHFHVSLQSGCDATLKRMNRKYTAEEYKTAVNKLMDNISDTAVTTDVMVGFPGETDDEFEQTFRFLEEISFAQMHIFKFSPRKGTPAADFKDQVPGSVKEERSNRLLEFSSKKNYEFNSRYTGKESDVLFEEEVEDMKGYYEGLTPNYIRVLCKGNKTLKGEIFKTRLEKAEKDYMLGSLLK